MRGSFEEYYPNERSFPAAAFSTLAIANVIRGGGGTDKQTESALSTAASRLTERAEELAANQELAAIAALARLNQIDGSLVPISVVASRLRGILSKQSNEGWFPEYYGADTGYLSVSLDCLWEISDACPQLDCEEAKRRSFSYLANMVLAEIPSLATINSRNTEYVVPYGIVRMVQDRETSSTALEILRKLDEFNLVSPRKLMRIDDRYSCHYVGRSIAKAWEFLSREKSMTPEFLQNIAGPPQSSMPEAGVFHLTTDRSEAGAVHVWVACKKGGSSVVSYSRERVAVDHGWRVQEGKRTFVSDWCAPDWVVTESSEHSVVVEGFLVPVTDVASTPLRHFVLRIAAAVLGRRLIPFLKKRLILKSNFQGPFLTRRVSITSESVTVRDDIANLTPLAIVNHAPKASLRHVASADSWSDFDVMMDRGVLIHDESQRSSSTFTSVRQYLATRSVSP